MVLDVLGENTGPPLIARNDDRLARISAGLKDLGFPVEKLKSDGLMVTDNGRSDFNEQLQFLASAMAKFPIDNGFRLLGDMTWAVEKGWSLDDIKRLEVMANQLLIRRNRLLLSQYDLACFGADGAMMAFDTHSLTIYRGEVKQSPYYVQVADGDLP